MLLVRPKNRLSWILGAAVAIAMTIIVMPGTPLWSEHQRHIIELGQSASQWTASFWSAQAPAPEDEWLSADAHKYSHGWPLEWMRQSHYFDETSLSGFPGEYCWIPLFETVPGQEAPAVAWATNDAWPWSGDYQWVRIGPLLLDLFIALIIVLGATRLFDLWLTRWRSGWSVRLKELLLITAASCVGLGWWQYHVKLQHKENEVVGEEEETNLWPAYKAYCGPVWLGKLVGNPTYLPFCSHWVEVTIPADDISDEQLNSLKNLAYLERVTLQAMNTRQLTYYTTEPLEMLDVPKMRSLLKNFRHLKQIDFACPTLAEQIPQFFALKNVDRFNIGDAGISEKDCQRLRQLDSRVLIDSSAGSGSERLIEQASGEFWLDLSGENVTRDTLEEFFPVRDKINLLVLGSHADIEAVMTFLQDCSEKPCVSFGKIQLSREQLHQLFTDTSNRNNKLPIQFDVRFQQADLTATDLTDWLSLLEARVGSVVRVLNSNLSRAQIRDLKAAFDQQQISFEVFRGMQLQGPVLAADSDR